MTDENMKATGDDPLDPLLEVKTEVVEEQDEVSPMIKVEVEEDPFCHLAPDAEDKTQGEVSMDSLHGEGFMKTKVPRVTYLGPRSKRKRPSDPANVQQKVTSLITQHHQQHTQLNQLALLTIVQVN